MLVAQDACHVVTLEYYRYVHGPVGGLAQLLEFKAVTYREGILTEVSRNGIPVSGSDELLVSGRF